MSPPATHPQPELVRRLKARKASHREHGVLYRSAFVVVGVLLLLAGIAMLALPGPAFVVIPVALAVLALEFSWAERLLDRSLVEAEKARRRAGAATPRQRRLTALAVAAAVVAFAVVLFDVPLLPV